MFTFAVVTSYQDDLKRLELILAWIAGSAFAIFWFMPLFLSRDMERQEEKEEQS